MLWLRAWFFLLKGFHNRFKINPSLTFFRLLIGAGFWVLLTLALLWGTHKIAQPFYTLHKQFPYLASKLLYQVIHLLLASLFPFLVLSHSITFLSEFFRSNEVAFLLTHPISGDLLLVLKGPKVFFQTSGFFLSISCIVLWRFGGGVWCLKGMLYLLGYACLSALMGGLLCLLLAFIVPPSYLASLFNFLFALAGAGFIFVMRHLFLVVMERPPIGPWMVPNIQGIPILKDIAQGMSEAFPNVVFFPTFVPLSMAFIAGSLFFWGIFHGLYLRAYQKSRENPSKQKGKKGFAPKKALIALWLKEWLSITRQPTRGSQGILMVVLLGIYALNLRLLPLDPEGIPYILPFHFGLVGFILSALSLRFTFPSESLEGKGVAFLKTHPISSWQRQRAKIAFYGIILSFLGVLLNGILFWTFPVPGKLKLLLMLWVIITAWVVVALAIWAGSLHPRYDATNPLQVGFSPEGIGFFTLSILFTAGMAYGLFKVLVGF